MTEEAEAANTRYWGWKCPSDAENEIEVTRVSDYWDKTAPALITISVSEEKAVDSYNVSFTCSVTLPDDAARELRDHLTELLGE